MRMLNLILKGTAVVALALWLGSCSDFLEVSPVNAPTNETFYNNVEQLEQAVASAYTPLQWKGAYSYDLPIVLGIISDDEDSPEASRSDVVAYNWQTESFKNNYSVLWMGVARACAVLDNAPDIPANTDAEKERRDRCVAEAKFLRGVYYWHLVTLWGPVPKRTTHSGTDYVKGNSTEEELWALIEKDLSEAVSSKTVGDAPALPDERFTGRAVLASAQAFYGKVLLHRGKLAAAAAQFEKVIQGGNHRLTGLDSVFTAEGEHDGENVFAVEFSSDGSIGNGVNPWINDHSNASEGELRGKFLGPQQAGGWEHSMPTQDLVDEFEDGDPRKTEFMFTDGDTHADIKDADGNPGGTWSSDKNKNSIPWGIKKGLKGPVKKAWPYGFGVNFPLIRYADVLLMRAECLAESDPATANQLVNQVRERAWGDATHTVETLMADSGWTLMQAIKHERRVELCFEGHRFIDLKRWGDDETVLGPLGYSSHNAKLPIPQIDIDVSDGKLKQNPGY